MPTTGRHRAAGGELFSASTNWGSLENKGAEHLTLCSVIYHSSFKGLAYVAHDGELAIMRPNL